MNRNDLNRRISRAQSYAKVKMARIKEKQRFDVKGTRFDPITKVPVHDMTSSQKSAYLRKLKNFNNRKTEFKVSAHRTALDPKKWDKYKQAEARANAMVRSDIAKYAKLKLPPPSRGTIGERLKAYTPEFGRLGHNNPAGTSMHELNRKPSNITDRRSLEVLTKSQISKGNPGYIAKKTRQGRKQFRQMLEAIGNKELMKAGDSLTDEQFKVLWNYTNFVNAVALDYHVYQQALISEQSFHARQHDTANRRANDWIKWAKQNI